MFSLEFAQQCTWLLNVTQTPTLVYRFCTCLSCFNVCVLVSVCVYVGILMNSDVIHQADTTPTMVSSNSQRCVYSMSLAVSHIAGASSS